MKISTVAAILLLLLSEAYASHEETSTRTTRRMRSVKIYSSTIQRNAEFGKDVDIVDPYIGLPDERERRQRGLAKHSKPKPKPSVESESVPNPNLEMSMPTAACMSAHQSLSYLQHDSNLHIFMPEQRGLKKGTKPKPSKGSVPTLEMSMPTGASMPDNLSFSYLLQGSTSTEENAVLPYHRRTAEEGANNSAMMTGHSSVIAAATMVSAIAVVAVLM